MRSSSPGTTLPRSARPVSVVGHTPSAGDTPSARRAPSARRFRPVRRGFAAALAVGAVLIAGCSAPDPEVTFYADRTATRVGPTQYCDATINSCAGHPGAAGVLRVPPGEALQVNLPSEIASTPWQIAFRYRDAQGHEQQERTRVFTPADKKLSYVLRLPDPADQLETAEVQQFGVGLLAPQSGDSAGGGFEFVIRGTWVLSVDDRPRS